MRLFPSGEPCPVLATTHLLTIISRNCTKHQVRCDYMDDTPSESAVPSPRSPGEAVLSTSDEAEYQSWRHGGIFPFPLLQIRQPFNPEHTSDIELRLLFHLCSTCNSLRLAGTSALTIWVDRITRFLDLASDYRFVLQALCSFSATLLAWEEGSAELRSLQAEYGAIALRGLHEAIGTFSQANADGIAAASIIMNWHCTDWMSSSSLMAGTHAVLSAMSPRKRHQVLSAFFPDDNLSISSFRPVSGPHLNHSERAQILNNVSEALRLARDGLTGQEMEVYWIGQMQNYIERLKHCQPAQTPELQFEHAYMLRKWTFWVPKMLLQRETARGPTLIVISHLYAAAVALQPLFPDLLSIFQSVMVMPPLEAVIDAAESLSWSSERAVQIQEMLQFSRQVAYDATFTHSGPDPSISRQSSGLSSSSESYSITDLSPAFAPSFPAMMQLQPSMSMSSHLNVPINNAGFAYGVSTWGMAPSPGFPPQDFASDILDTSSVDLLDLQGGFVNTIPIWV